MDYDALIAKTNKNAMQQCSVDAEIIKNIASNIEFETNSLRSAADIKKYLANSSNPDQKAEIIIRDINGMINDIDQVSDMLKNMKKNLNYFKQNVENFMRVSRL